MNKAIVVHGNPVDGFEFIGPFDDVAQAAEFGNTNAHLEGDWWVAELQPLTP